MIVSANLCFVLLQGTIRCPLVLIDQEKNSQRWYVTIVVNHGLQRRMGLLLR